MAFSVPEKYRKVHPLLGKGRGNNGYFFVTVGFVGHSTQLNCIASDGGGWDHVSVSRPDRCPTWDEMCAVKNMFWGEEDCVVQFHPPKSEYVNNHQFCLHLWRPNTGEKIPMPLSVMVGIK